MRTDRSQSAIRSTAASPTDWNTAPARLSVSTRRAAKESKGVPSTGTGSTTSASSAAGDSDSSVIRMTLAPRAFASATTSLAASSWRRRSKTIATESRPARRYLPTSAPSGSSAKSTLGMSWSSCIASMRATSREK